MKQLISLSQEVGILLVGEDFLDETVPLTDSEASEAAGGSWDQPVTGAEIIGAFIEEGNFEAAYMLGGRTMMEGTIQIAKKQGFYSDAYKKAEEFLKSR